MKLSIITINYNNCSGLQKTIDSVLSQTFKDFEYIIIDGGSTDGSADVIEKFKHKIDYCVSEKDDGIYHAMNKGISLAKGKYISFLNSGDCLANNNILNEALPLLDNKDIIYGDYIVEASCKTEIKKYPDKLTFTHFFYDSLSHSAAAFIKKEGFKNELSIYDESLKIAADWKWYLLAIFKYNYSYKHIDRIIGIFDFTGASAINHDCLNQEKQYVFKKDFGEIYNELSQLLVYKVKYETLLSSRFIKMYFTLKKLINWKK